MHALNKSEKREADIRVLLRANFTREIIKTALGWLQSCRKAYENGRQQSVHRIRETYG